MELPDHRPALLIIDIQKGHDDVDFYGGGRNNRNAERNCGHLLYIWRKASLPVIHIQHSSQNPDSPLFEPKQGFQIKDEVKPLSGEPVIVKNTSNAFLDSKLKEHLDKSNIQTLVLVGITTNHCVSSTARMASDLGYNTIVISDATACFDQLGINGEKYAADLIHKTTLASLKDEFATIMTSEEIEKWINS